MINRRREVEDCKLCCPESELTIKAPLRCKDGKERMTPCKRLLYKNDSCIVTLDPTQLSRGHAIAVLRKHRKDITDPELSPKEHHELIDAVRKVACMIKQKLSCERVYVATLCDGIEHLHYHIIPRYKTDIKGFAFIGQREYDHQNGYWIGPEKKQDRVTYLEKIAKEIREKIS